MLSIQGEASNVDAGLDVTEIGVETKFSDPYWACSSCWAEKVEVDDTLTV